MKDVHVCLSMTSHLWGCRDHWFGFQDTASSASFAPGSFRLLEDSSCRLDILWTNKQYKHIKTEFFHLLLHVQVEQADFKIFQLNLRARCLL